MREPKSSKRRQLRKRSIVQRVPLSWNHRVVTMGLLLASVRCATSYIAMTPYPNLKSQHFHFSLFGSPYTRAYPTALKYHSTGDGGEVDRDMALLNERLQQMKVDILEDEVQRPPNPSLDPYDVVEVVMDGLLHYDDPLPLAGFRFMLRASTLEWKTAIRQSVGAPEDASEDLVASALGDAIGRPSNHFGILVGADDAEKYRLVFRKEFDDESFMWFDGNDYYEDANYQKGDDNEDGVNKKDKIQDDEKDLTFYLECELRGKKDNELLVLMGWQLQKRETDGSWLIHRIDWQDFRVRYKPGIGREDWMRDTMRRFNCL